LHRCPLQRQCLDLCKPRLSSVCLLRCVHCCSQPQIVPSDTVACIGLTGNLEFDNWEAPDLERWRQKVLCPVAAPLNADGSMLQRWPHRPRGWSPHLQGTGGAQGPFHLVGPVAIKTLSHKSTGIDSTSLQRILFAVQSK
jgi:hypothetical protein